MSRDRNPKVFQAVMGRETGAEGGDARSVGRSLSRDPRALAQRLSAPGFRSAALLHAGCPPGKTGANRVNPADSCLEMGTARGVERAAGLGTSWRQIPAFGLRDHTCTTSPFRLYKKKRTSSFSLWPMPFLSRAAIASSSAAKNSAPSMFIPRCAVNMSFPS